jgi:hypothetical protein
MVIVVTLSPFGIEDQEGFFMEFPGFFQMVFKSIVETGL